MADQPTSEKLELEIKRLKQKISILEKSEASLKESSTKFQRLYESFPLPSQSLDPNGYFIEVNPAWLDLLGYSLEEVIGKSFSNFLHPDWREHFKEHFPILKRVGEVLGVEFEMVKKDGSFILVSLNGNISKDKYGKVQQTHCIFQDITEQKQNEDKIKEITAQLQQSHKMEAIGILAGGIAHDFNNILFPIFGYTQMLIDDVPEDSPLRNSLDEILAAGMRARDLVKQILTFSRQGSGELQPMQMQLIVKEALKLIRSSIPRVVEIKQSIQSDCGLIQADPTQIHQILMNLTTNAYHAMEETGGIMDVKLHEVTLGGNEWTDENLQPGQYALLSVSDNGCGIPQSQLDKIFEPYFTTKDKNKGTGLGLSIIYGIVKEYKGVIKVSSEFGKGTTVNIYLPLMKRLSSRESIHGIPKIIPTGMERILLVDDEIPILNLQKQIFERLGYKVTEQSSSIEALRVFTTNPDDFDLVVTDMTMPNMTGDNLAKELTSIKPGIPIIICTGFSERMNEDLSKRIGIKGFLMKPIIKSVMAKEVRRVLDETYPAKNPSRKSI